MSVPESAADCGGEAKLAGETVTAVCLVTDRPAVVVGRRVGVERRYVGVERRRVCVEQSNAE